MNKAIQIFKHDFYGQEFADVYAALEYLFQFSLTNELSFIVTQISGTKKIEFVLLGKDEKEVLVYQSYNEENKKIIKRIGCVNHINNRLNFLNWLGSKTIAVVGPDGSGKTTLIDAVAGELSGKYRFKRFKRYIRRVMPYLCRYESRNVREQKLLWFILPVAWATFFLGATVFRSKKTTILDRYFYDYLLKQPEHIRPARVAGYAFWSRVLPRPKKLIVAMCDSSIIRNRKQEMTQATISEIYDLYIDQVISGKLQSVLFCNTGIDQAASCASVINYLNS